MRAAYACCAALLLAGCATPKPILDAASLVSKMSEDMDRSVVGYVDSLKIVREADAQRLQKLRRDAQSRRVPVQEQLQILKIADDDRVTKVLSDLVIPPDADPLGPDAGVAAPPAAVGFDDASLRNVATIARGIAAPAAAAEQLRVLLTFAKTVNNDLQKAADSNKKPPAPQPRGPTR